MSENLSTEQYFESMLQEALGQSFVEKQGGVWPPKGTYSVTFGAVDESKDEGSSLPNCFIPGHAAIKVPYTVDKAALPKLRGYQGEYVFWFSTKIGAEIAMDQMVLISGSERIPFNSKLDASGLIALARDLNGQSVKLVRDVVTTKKGKRAPQDKFFTADAPTTRRVTAAPEPSFEALQAADDDLPF